jgi:hypothetical protein
VKKLNDLHTHPTFKRHYERFSRIFIDSFCYHRRNTIDRPTAISLARKDVERQLTKEIKTGAYGVKLMVLAYKKVCSDSELVEKAINYYRGMEKIK